jgi:ABC-type glycerol-3-phosphate transport system substrate-binding protein
MKMKMGLISMVIVSLSVLSACGSQQTSGDNTSKTETPHEPVVLKLYPGQLITPEDMSIMINEPLQKKYPYISVEVIDRSKNPLQDYVAMGGQMDLITQWNGSLSSNMDLGIFEDISPLAQKQGLDLGRFDSQAVETVRTISNDGKLYGLPYNEQFNALYYNKDIFDKFGVTSPKDGMTWEEAIDLSKKLTRQVDGVQYRGLDPESVARMSFPLSLNIVDAKTNKVSVNSEPYKKLFEMANNVYSVPGNKPAKWNTSSYDAFMKDKTVAMVANVNLFPYLAQVSDLNWDLVQYPSYKEKPNVYGMFDLHIMSVSKTSKYKDEAMKVLEVLFSDEVQMIATKKTGRVSPLKDPKFQQAYGSEMPLLKGKNIQSIFKSKPAPAPRLSTYYSKASSIMVSKFQEYADGKKDINTALRETEEETVKYIQEQTQTK